MLAMVTGIGLGTGCHWMAMHPVRLAQCFIVHQKLAGTGLQLIFIVHRQLAGTWAAADEPQTSECKPCHMGDASLHQGTFQAHDSTE